MKPGTSFLFRHAGYTAKNARKAWATRKAMNAYGKAHPICEFDKKTAAIHVHHVEPISEAPERAADPTNFISLGGKRNHLVVGHAGNWRHHVKNVREICDAVQIDRDIDD